MVEETRSGGTYNRERHGLFAYGGHMGVGLSGPASDSSADLLVASRSWIGARPVLRTGRRPFSGAQTARALGRYQTWIAGYPAERHVVRPGFASCLLQRAIPRSCGAR